MDGKLLSSGDVCEIAGIPAPTLDEWCKKGVLTPVSGGDGHGSHRRFSLMQTVGIVLAVKLRQTKRGCALSFVRDVVEAFKGMPEQELLRAFEVGRTHFANSIYGKGH